MKFNQKLTCCLSLIFAVLCPHPVSAVSFPGANLIFSTAEKQFPTVLTPAGTETQTYMEWTYRYYSKYDLYVGINENDEFYLLQNGQLSYLGTLENILLLLNMKNSGNNDCVDTNLPVLNLKNKYRIESFSGPVAITQYLQHHYLQVSKNEISADTIRTDPSDIEQFFHLYIAQRVADDMLYHISIDDHEKSTSACSNREYSPDKLLGPFSQYCISQAWFADAVTTNFKLVDSNGKQHEKVSLPKIAEVSHVEEINESVDSPLGKIRAIRYRVDLSNGDYQIKWFSVKYGVDIKSNTYNTSGILKNKITLIDLIPN